MFLTKTAPLVGFLAVQLKYIIATYSFGKVFHMVAGHNTPNDIGYTPDLKSILVNQKLLSESAYDQAFETAQSFDQKIEDYLLKSGLIPHLKLQQAIAISQGLKIQFIDAPNAAQHYELDQSLSAKNGYEQIANYGNLNLINQTQETADTHLNVGFSEASTLNSNPKQALTARDFRTIFIRQNEAELTQQAANLLGKKEPHLTAKYGMLKRQKFVIILVLLLIFMAFVAYQINAFYYISICLSCVFLFASTLKVYSLFLPKIYGLSCVAAPNRTDDKDLPIYSILVPLFNEANIVEQLTVNLLALDYPRSKLDIKLLFEQTDHETIAAAKRLNLPECFEFFVVTDSLPRTKPKAMNFVLPFVRGDYVTIYDAEDRPAPDQLRKAITKFESEDANLACLQASLEYENWNENWLTRHFFIEYATQFNRHLWALDRLHIPLPLGGTSNHFKTKILREVGGWDAYNVTEDADLGIRLALKGYRAGLLNSITFEEATHKLYPWIKQRRRWLKGWIQTIIVHSRQPIKLYKKIGIFRFIGFLALMSGMIFSSLLHPIILALPFILYFTFDFSIVMSSNLHISMFVLSLSALVIGYSAALLSNFQAIAEFKRWRLLPTLISSPVYWLLISISAWLAIYEYYKNPFYWAKTEHRVSKHLHKKPKL